MAAAHHADALGTELAIHQGCGTGQVHLVASSHDIGNAALTQVIQIGTACQLADDTQAVGRVALGPQQGAACFHDGLPMFAVMRLEHLVGSDSRTVAVLEKTFFGIVHQGRYLTLDCRIEVQGFKRLIITVTLYLFGHGTVNAPVNRCHHVANHVWFLHVCLELIEYGCKGGYKW